MISRLVLTRKPGQTIIVGSGDNRVVATVVRLKGGAVQIAIEGERSIPIRRGELEPRGDDDPRAVA